VIQASPHIETPQVSPAGEVRNTGPGKKEGLGVFAKILAGLLRKTGEKPSPEGPDLPDLGLRAAEGPEPGLKTAEVPEAEDSGIPGLGSRKRAAGALRSGQAGKNPVQDGVKRPAAADDGLLDPERDLHELSGEGLLFNLPWKPQTGEPEPGEGAGIPAGPEALSPGEAPGETELPIEEGREKMPGNLDFGDLLGVAWGEAAAEAEEPGGRKGRAGEDFAHSPAENFSFGQQAEGPGPALGGDLRRDGGGGRGRDEARPAEARRLEKRRDRLNIEVRDLRTGNDTASGPLNAQNLRPQETQPLPGRGDTEILVELRGENPGREAPQALDHSWEGRAGRSFEDFLARELHQNLNGDIVRHASAALRDGGEGTIRLALRPESLGNVKIRLEMAENKVTGHIIVESEAAFRAFEREVSSLEQAFRDSGFDAADLNMSLARDGGGAERGWNGEEPDRPVLPKQLAALRYDAAFERLEQAAGEARMGIFTQNGRIAVNMLV
jgi:hypothetical protein